MAAGIGWSSRQRLGSAGYGGNGWDRLVIEATAEIGSS
jgi:hypothetical protein